MAATRGIAVHHEVERSGGTTIRYTVSGVADGPTLVFVHGWGCNRTDFDAAGGSLPQDYRIISIDLAEHGESRSSRTEWTMAEFALDIAAVLEAESVDRFIIVGHSMGGAVAVEVARLLPDAVVHVICLDALHYLFLFPAQTHEQVEVVMQPFREDFTAAMQTMVEVGSPPGTDPALIDVYVEKMGGVRQPAGLEALKGLLEWDMDRVLDQVKQPITVFAVRELLSQEAVDRYRGRITIVPVDLGTHHFVVESPEATAALLANVVRVTWTPTAELGSTSS